MPNKKHENSSFKSGFTKNKKKIIIFSLAGVVGLTTIGTIAGIASCVHKQKIIVEKDKEIQILKLKINNLTIEIDKLKQEKQRNEEEIVNLQIAKSDATKQSTFLNQEIQKLIKQSITINISESGNTNPDDNTDDNSKVNTDDLIKKSNENLISVIKEQLNLSATKYRNTVSRFINQKTRFESKLSANILSTFDQIIKKARNVVNTIDSFEYFDIKQATNNLNQYTHVEKIFLDEQAKLNTVLFNELNEKQKRNEFLTSELQNSFNKLKDNVEKSINTSKQQLSFVRSMQADLNRYLNKKFDYMDEQTAQELKKQIKDLLTHLLTYENELDTSIQKVEEAYSLALKTNSYKDFLLIDIDRFAKSNKNFKEQLDTVYKTDNDILYNAFKKKTAELLLKTQENQELTNQISTIENELQKTSESLSKEKEKNAKTTAELVALKTKMKDELSKTLITTIKTLDKISTSLENSDKESTRNLATPLKKQSQILKSALNEYTSNNFVDKYQPIVANAMQSIHNIIEQYKQNELIPLKAEYQRLSAELTTKNAKLNEVNQKLNEVEALYQQTTSLLALKEQELIDLNAEIEQKTNLLKEAIANLDKIQKQQSENLDQAKINYQKLKDLRTNAISKAQNLINEIDDNQKTQTLQNFVDVVIDPANENDFNDVESKITLLSNNTYNIFSEMLKVQEEYSSEQKADLNSKIQELNVQKENVIQDKNTAENELNDAKSQLSATQNDLAVKEIEIQKLNNNSSALIEQIKQHNAEIESLKKQIALSEQNYEESKAKLQDLKAKISKLYTNDKIESKRNENDMKGYLRQWIKKVNDPSVTYKLSENLNTEITPDENIADPLERDKDTFRRLKDFNILMTNNLDEAIKIYFKRKISKGNAQLSTLQTEINGLNSQVNVLESQKDSLEQEVNSLDTNVQLKTNELNAKTQKLAELESQIQQQDSLIAQQNSQITDLNSKNDELNQKIEGQKKLKHKLESQVEYWKNFFENKKQFKSLIQDNQQLVFDNSNSFWTLKNEFWDENRYIHDVFKPHTYESNIETFDVTPNEYNSEIVLHFMNKNQKEQTLKFDLSNLPLAWKEIKYYNDKDQPDNEVVVDNSYEWKHIPTNADDPNDDVIGIKYKAYLSLNSRKWMKIRFRKVNENLYLDIVYIYKAINGEAEEVLYNSEDMGQNDPWHFLFSRTNHEEARKLTNEYRKQEDNLESHNLFPTNQPKANNIKFADYSLVSAEIK